MTSQHWALPELAKLVPVDEDALKEIITYTETLSDDQAADHLRNLLGDSPQALNFITSYIGQRAEMAPSSSSSKVSNRDGPLDAKVDHKHSEMSNGSRTDKQGKNDVLPSYAPPAYPPPSQDVKKPSQIPSQPIRNGNGSSHRVHTNKVIEAAHVRARDEQQMQNWLQSLQFQYGIYNSDIEPEHEADYYCRCPIHLYKMAKYDRQGVQKMWSNAVMYPGEKAYNDSYRNPGLFSSNPYRMGVNSPYGYYQTSWGPSRPRPDYHATSIHQTINLNNSLNREAQAKIDSKEPKVNIWHDDELSKSVSRLSIVGDGDKKLVSTEKSDRSRPSLAPVSTNGQSEKSGSSSKLGSFRKAIGIKSSEERAVAKSDKISAVNRELREAIELEERGRWPDEQWRRIVAEYQEKTGMTRKIADLRVRFPIQYLHLLKAGYFEPIPVAWAGSVSNPLKFSIESASGWRGITPAWRGYEDTAEERLYWVLNHREGSAGTRMKPDFISEMEMARARMALAVEPPPEYYSAEDTCHVQHMTSGYSKQVMPPPFRPFDRPEQPTDDTMILLDVSGSMDFDPVRPIYNQYLITGYANSTQPKNKDVAKAIIRRFTDAMSNHDHNFQGYSLVTFANESRHIGTINHQNLDTMWRNVRVGGGTRVMTGWQKVKELHFQKHSESATHHPILGWQAGPQTPMLRLLLLLDGEATDMDEFELDLLGLNWAHVTIFLIGVDGCPHHHRHANELARISDVNHHVSFVDAQGNTPERFVTHELLKRHLGYEVSIAEFQQLEELPPYSVQG